MQPSVAISLLGVGVYLVVAVQAEAGQIGEVVGSPLGPSDAVVDDPDGQIAAALAHASRVSDDLIACS